MIARLLLSDAIRRVAECREVRSLSNAFHDLVGEFHDALRAGKLTARGREKSSHGKVIKQDRPLPRKVFSVTERIEFWHCCCNDRFVYLPPKNPRADAERIFTNVTVADTDVDRLFPPPEPVRTGAAGRPSSKQYYLEGLEEMARQGQLPGVAATAAALNEWMKQEHPYMPRAKQKSLENMIRREHRRLKASQAIK